MTSNDSLMLYAKLAGFRLIVLANRLCCDSDFDRELHDRRIDGLQAAIDRLRIIMELERRLLANDEFAAFQLEGETEIFGRFAIDLLDDVEIDHETHEYRINDGGWINVLAVDDSGVSVDYPELVSLTNVELGSLAPIIAVGEARFLDPNDDVQDAHRPK
ncbi:hypothetical protein [Rhizobium sp. 007]|uniref:hypothetical protein n=1 Tax=Rhizobium sp. 007 TaxID=2785056 RepID=UPI00188E61E7|nr:hypothetical protein [Rhizobium sp. 007]QPB24246.1 hypothetical protein ISN39_32215 [Rhizobium sp. 007]